MGLESLKKTDSPFLTLQYGFAPVVDADMFESDALPDLAKDIILSRLLLRVINELGKNNNNL